MPSLSSTEGLLCVRELQVEFGGSPVVRAVRGVSFSIERGQTLGLVGESGSGKSASALAILNLLPKPVGRIAGGSIRFDGRELIGLSEASLRRVRGRQISMIFQDPLSSFNPVLTIGRQITEVLETQRGYDRNAARRRAIDLLGIVGIPTPKRQVNRYPHEFSGGMRQRAMIAMALAGEPALLIADEPTTALDVTIQAQILELLDSLRSQLGMAILLITHDLGVVAAFAERLAIMYAGRIVEAGPTAEVLSHPSHPYTVGLLHAIPRLDRPRMIELTPIMGSPPDLASELIGCPFAPRCAWRMDVCFSVDPPLLAVRQAAENVRVESQFSACHNRPLPDEAAAGHPLRAGFQPSSPPARIGEALDVTSSAAAGDRLVLFQDATGGVTPASDLDLLGGNPSAPLSETQANDQPGADSGRGTGSTP